MPRDPLDIAFDVSASAIAGALRASDVTADPIVGLLRPTGSLPPAGGESPEEYDRISEAALDRFREMLTRLLEIALRFAVEDDREYLRGLRNFYLEPRASYSVDELAAIWRTSSDEVRDVFHDEIDEWFDAHPDSPTEPRIGWREAVDANDAFAIARAFDVERAFGNDFLRVRPPEQRTVTVPLHLPRFITDAISSTPPASCRPLAARLEQFILDWFVMDGIGSSGARNMQTRCRKTPRQ